MHAIVGTKVQQTQKFLIDGTRIPVTVVATQGNPVVMVKTKDTDGYWAVQLGMGIKKHANKPQAGHAKKAHLDKAPYLLTEVRFSDKQAESMPEVGSVITPDMVFEPGDMVDATGVSKGKGFAGGVKRYGFAGGPKTHGQSDRWRAPGSIGSGTTPGRVYRGKRMAGKMGNDTTTVKNLEVVYVTPEYVWVKGLVPGALNGSVVITATGKKDKHFVEVLTDAVKGQTEEVVEEVKAEEPVVEETVVEPTKEEVKEVEHEETKAEEGKTE